MLVLAFVDLAKLPLLDTQEATKTTTAQWTPGMHAFLSLSVRLRFVCPIVRPERVVISIDWEAARSYSRAPPRGSRGGM